VQADAGKTGGPVESLLIEHAQIRQNAGAIGKPDETIVALASAELTPPSQLSNLRSPREITPRATTSHRLHRISRGETKEKRAFEDRHENTKAYIDYLRPRCVQLAHVLKKTGSFYYHCDWHASQVKQKDKAGRPDIDAFEAMLMREDCEKGFFVSFDYSSDALQEIESFFKRSHKVIVALTVQEILDEHIAKKLV